MTWLWRWLLRGLIKEMREENANLLRDALEQKSLSAPTQVLFIETGRVVS